MNADEHRRHVHRATYRIRDILDSNDYYSDSQYLEALKEVEEQAMIARMAMQRVVDIERGAQ